MKQTVKSTTRREAEHSGRSHFQLVGWEGFPGRQGTQPRAQETPPATQGGPGQNPLERKLLGEETSDKWSRSYLDSGTETQTGADWSPHLQPRVCLQMCFLHSHTLPNGLSAQEGGDCHPPASAQETGGASSASRRLLLSGWPSWGPCGEGGPYQSVLRHTQDHVVQHGSTAEVLGYGQATQAVAGVVEVPRPARTGQL